MKWQSTGTIGLTFASELHRRGAGLPRHQGTERRRRRHAPGGAQEPRRPAGAAVPFALREVEAPEPDEDDEPITTMVVDWDLSGASGEARLEPDPWSLCCRRQDQRTAMLRLKQVLTDVLANQGIDLPIPPDGPVMRMADLELVREQFYSRTPTMEGTVRQQRDRRRIQFDTALGGQRRPG